ncbi:MAG: VOC family protein [Burkholderiales bacterium]|jgi:predicted enzyme related to lactoylglutathione lyase
MSRPPLRAVWFELPAIDLDRAVRFYEAVLGAEFMRERVDGHEMAFFSGGTDADGIVGAIATGDVYRPSVEGAIVYFGVDDVEAVLRRATAHGGEVLYPATSIGERGMVGEFRDSEGNRVALHAPPPALKPAG